MNFEKSSFKNKNVQNKQNLVKIFIMFVFPSHQRFFHHRLYSIPFPSSSMHLFSNSHAVLLCGTRTSLELLKKLTPSHQVQIYALDRRTARVICFHPPHRDGNTKLGPTKQKFRNLLLIFSNNTHCQR